MFFAMVIGSIGAGLLGSLFWTLIMLAAGFWEMYRYKEKWDYEMTILVSAIAFSIVVGSALTWTSLQLVPSALNRPANEMGGSDLLVSLVAGFGSWYLFFNTKNRIEDYFEYVYKPQQERKAKAIREGLISREH